MTAIVLGAAACLLLVVNLIVLSVRRRAHGRHARTMQLSLTLLRYDEGLGALADHTRRSQRWWEDVDPREQHLIDRALSMWDLAAWYVTTGRVERRAVLDVFSWNIVDLWERAYPYVLHRRVEQPSLWPSLTDLYVDAYDATRAAARPKEPPHRGYPSRSVSPARLGGEPDEERAAVVSPEPVRVPAAEPIPAPASSPVVRDVWLKALQDAGPVTPPPVRRDPRPRLPAAEDVTQDWRPVPPRRPSATVEAPRRSLPGLEIDHVVDLTEAQPTVRGAVGG